MADKVSKFIFPVKNGTQITDKEFELPSVPDLGTAAYKDVPSSGNASSGQVVMGNDSRLSDSRNAKDVSAWAKAASKPTYTASEVGAIATTAKGAANGVAELDSSGKVPSSQLPSYVDDVLEYDSLSAFPSTGETGKIYVAKDTNKSYRWTGSAYSQIKGDLALGETSSTAYRGDRGKVAYDHSQSTHARTDATKTEASSTNGNIKINGTETKVYTHPGSGTNPHGTTKSDVGLGNVGNFKAVSTVASQGLSDTEKANARANIGAGTSSLQLGTTASTAAPGDHNHDDRYYTKAEENDIIDGVQTQLSNLFCGVSIIIDDVNNAPLGVSTAHPNSSNAPYYFWSTIITFEGSVTGYKQQLGLPWAYGEGHIFLRVTEGGDWSPWYTLANNSLGDIDNTTDFRWNLSSRDSKTACPVHYDGKPFIYIDGVKHHFNLID